VHAVCKLNIDDNQLQENRLMNRIYLSILVASLVFGPLACSDSKSSTNAKSTSQSKTALKVDTFLNSVPAETTYFVNFDSSTLPTKSIKTIQDGAASNPDFRKALAESAKSSNPSERFGGLVIGALLDNFVANTFNKLGLAQRPRIAAYGLGLWPVVMADLKDSSVFEKWLTGLESTAKITAKTETFEGITYRLYPIEKQVASIFSISEGKVVFAIIPTELKTQMLPYVLGKKTPDAALNTSKRFQRLISTYGAKSNNLFFLDTLELFKTLASKGKGLNKSLIVQEMSQFNLDAVCVGEISALLESSPLFVASTNTLTETVTEGEVVWEMTPALATDLMSIASTRAGTGASTASALASIGLAIDSGKVIDLVKKAAAAVAAKPFKCGELMDMNKNLAQMNGQLLFVPPFARAFKAIDIVISGWDFAPSGDFSTSSPRAHIILSADNAPMVFEALKGLVPMLASLPAMKDNGEPVALNQFPLPPFLKAPHIAIGKHAIGISVGEGEAARLKAVLSSGKTSPAPILTFAYDLDGFLKIVKAVAKNSPEAAVALKEIDKMGLSGRSTTTVEMKKTGLHTKSRQVMSK
jgi:hypothetical protein